jgi:hypothetical protein
MESSKIIEKIDDIYLKLQIPPWLQLHMKRTAEFAEIICDNFELDVNKDDIIARNLLHDLGNVIKMKLDTDFSKKLAKDSGDEKGMDFWKEVQRKIIAKYGKDELEATRKMVREINANENIIELIENAEFFKNVETLKSTEWERKICAYSDQRIGPYGILELDERYEEHKNRYKRDKEYHSKLRMDCFEAGLEIEKEIKKHIKLKLGNETINQILRLKYNQ